MKILMLIASLWSAFAIADPCCEISAPSDNPQTYSEAVIVAADCDSGRVAWRVARSTFHSDIDKARCQALKSEHEYALGCTAVRAEVVVKKLISLAHPFGGDTIVSITNVRDIGGVCL